MLLRKQGLTVHGRWYDGTNSPGYDTNSPGTERKRDIQAVWICALLSNVDRVTCYCENT